MSQAPPIRCDQSCAPRPSCSVQIPVQAQTHPSGPPQPSSSPELTQLITCSYSCRSLYPLLLHTLPGFPCSPFLWALIQTRPTGHLGVKSSFRTNLRGRYKILTAPVQSRGPQLTEATLTGRGAHWPPLRFKTEPVLGSKDWGPPGALRAALP